jgi:hypothetical protein
MQYIRKESLSIETSLVDGKETLHAIKKSKENKFSETQR